MRSLSVALQAVGRNTQAADDAGAYASTVHVFMDRTGETLHDKFAVFLRLRENFDSDE